MNSDTQLKQALAKMLTERIRMPGFYWKGECPEGRGLEPCILDTELLHLCWLVEEALTVNQMEDYSNELLDLVKIPNEPWGKLVLHASWQHRVIALAKVKGIEQ